MENIQKQLAPALKALSDKKGKNIIFFDIGSKIPLTDYFVIASGSSTTQVKALSNGVEEEMKKQNILPLRREGYQEGRWILLDYDDFIVHLFLEEERELYALDRYWADVPQYEYVEK